VIDGKTRDTRNTLWDLDAERALPFPGGFKTVPAAAWSPDGRSLAVGRPDGDVLVASVPSGKEEARIRFPGRILLLTWSADGHYLAIAGGNSTQVWDQRTRTFATPNLVHPAAVTTLAFHPQGRYLATGCRDNLARVFAVGADSAKPLWPPVPHVQAEGSVWYPTFFSPPLFVDAARALITYGGKGRLTWRAVETGKEVRTVDSPEFSERIAAAKLSPDGRELAVFGVPSIVRLFEAATGKPFGPALEHKNTVFDAVFSPDTQMLLTGSSDNIARVWTASGSGIVARPLDLHRTVHLVAFAPDGRSLATQDSELIRVWALPREAVPMVRVPLDSGNAFATLSPDGALVIPTGTCFPVRALGSTRAHRVANRPGLLSGLAG
jgi:WD40 repeat protein